MSIEDGLMPEDVRVDYWLDGKTFIGETVVTSVELDGSDQEFVISRAVYEAGKRIESSSNE